MTILLKLGGSLLTDKTQESTYRQDQAGRIAQEIAQVLEDKPGTQLIIGHGSGSFGHFAAKRYGTIKGVYSKEDWRGFAEVAYAAAELNALVAKTLHIAGLSIIKIQPSATAIADNGTIVEMNLRPLTMALKHGLIPLVYGDVAIDKSIGGTIISTETIFTHIAENMRVSKIILVGEVDGVYDADEKTISEITPTSLPQIENYLSGSRGTDVTGGMLTKVSDMLELVQKQRGLSIHIIDGLNSGILHAVLTGTHRYGTTIHAD